MINNIKTLRKQKKLTLEQLAEISSLSRSFLCEIESGKTNPGLESAYKIAAALGVSVYSAFPDPSGDPDPNGDRIERLEYTVKTLVAWLTHDLGLDNVKRLHDMIDGIDNE